MDWSRSDIATVSLAASGLDVAFDQLRVHYLLFLVDREVAGRIGGPFFDFRPYSCGPFDPAVCRVLEELDGQGYIRTEVSGRYPRYLLTNPGEQRGATILNRLPDAVETYIRKASRWAQLMPYRRMLSALHRRYPEIAVTSVVGDLGPPRRSEAQGPFFRGMARAFDLSGTLHGPASSRGPSGSDANAIREAWWAVGEALEDAMTKFGRTQRLW